MVIYFFQKRSCLKSVSHDIKILDLEQSDAYGFMDVIRYSSMVGLCVVAYVTINYGMQTTFAERWNSNVSYFHILIGGNDHHLR